MSQIDLLKTSHSMCSVRQVNRSHYEVICPDCGDKPIATFWTKSDALLSSSRHMALRSIADGVGIKGGAPCNCKRCVETRGGIGPSEHGANGYTNWGCRCDVCRVAAVAANRRSRRERAERGLA